MAVDERTLRPINNNPEVLAGQEAPPVAHYAYDADIIDEIQVQSPQVIAAKVNRAQNEMRRIKGRREFSRGEGVSVLARAVESIK